MGGRIVLGYLVAIITAVASLTGCAAKPVTEVKEAADLDEERIVGAICAEFEWNKKQTLTKNQLAAYSIIDGFDHTSSAPVILDRARSACPATFIEYDAAHQTVEQNARRWRAEQRKRAERREEAERRRDQRRAASREVAGGDDQNPPAKNICEAQNDWLNDEYDAGRLTDRQYDAELDVLYEECYYQLD